MHSFVLFFAMIIKALTFFWINVLIYFL
jgi:hypothetical protein